MTRATGWRVGRVLVFDLDDTLYPERDFVFSGFRAVGDWAAAEWGLKGLETACAELFIAGHRGRVFDHALKRFGRGDPAAVQRLVAVYRGHAPRISLAPDARRALERFEGPMGLISDGPAATQAAKLAALGLAHRFDPCLLTGAMGPGAGKPSERAFREVEAASGLPPSRHVYVADNPRKDFLAPRRRGWFTVMIERPERIHRLPAPGPAHAAHAWLTTLDDLEDRLAAGFQSAGTQSVAAP